MIQLFMFDVISSIIKSVLSSSVSFTDRRITSSSARFIAIRSSSFRFSVSLSSCARFWGANTICGSYSVRVQFTQCSIFPQFGSRHSKLKCSSYSLFVHVHYYVVCVLCRCQNAMMIQVEGITNLDAVDPVQI